MITVFDRAVIVVTEVDTNSPTRFMESKSSLAFTSSQHRNTGGRPLCPGRTVAAAINMDQNLLGGLMR